MNIFIAFFAGILSFLSPCVFPLIPTFLCYMAGVACQSPDKNQIKQIILHAVFYVLGFSVIFTLLGSALGGIGSLLSQNIWLFKKIAGIFIILLGLHFIYKDFLSFLGTPQKISFASRTKFPLINSFLLGMLFAIGWTPCVGPILASILLLAGSTQSAISGMLLLFIYSIGLGIPFIAMSLLMNLSLRFNTFISGNLEKISKISGFFLIILGIILLL